MFFNPEFSLSSLGFFLARIFFPGLPIFSRLTCYPNIFLLIRSIIVSWLYPMFFFLNFLFRYLVIRASIEEFLSYAKS